jgi:hypothetical protein
VFGTLPLRFEQAGCEGESARLVGLDEPALVFAVGNQFSEIEDPLVRAVEYP